MSNELLSGFFTIIGAGLGFGLVKISDWTTARNERNKARKALLFKLYKIRDTLTANKNNIQEVFPTITTLIELKTIQSVITGSEIQKEFLKIEILFEELFTPDLESPTLFINFSNLSIYLKSLMTIADLNIERFPDKKPQVIVHFVVTIDALNRIIAEIPKK